MMGLEGYTGPTSGRMTIGADGEITNREQFFDAPLTKDELAATADFRSMSPHEQAREVRRLRFNLAVATDKVNGQRDIIRRQDEELTTLRAKLATFTPDGYQLPPAAAKLLAHAQACGWHTTKAWVQDQGHAALHLVLRHGRYAFQLSWHCTPDGRGHMVRRGLARAPMRDWHDAPSLLRIEEIIQKVGVRDDQDTATTHSQPQHADNDH
jgi:hypothetical protein